METIKNIWFENGRIYMRSNKDKVYSRPLEAFPILKEANEKERNDFVIGKWGDDIRWEALDEDIHISSFFEEKEPEYNNEVAEMFNRLPWLNVSEVARSIGIHKSLLSKYIYGIKKPSAARIMQIRHTLHSLGEEMIAV